MGQKFTYTQLVFGSIAFKLFNLSGISGTSTTASEIAERQI